MIIPDKIIHIGFQRSFLIVYSTQATTHLSLAFKDPGFVPALCNVINTSTNPQVIAIIDFPKCFICLLLMAPS